MRSAHDAALNTKPRQRDGAKKGCAVHAATLHAPFVVVPGDCGTRLRVAHGGSLHGASENIGAHLLPTELAAGKALKFYNVIDGNAGPLGHRRPRQRPALLTGRLQETRHMGRTPEPLNDGFRFHYGQHHNSELHPLVNSELQRWVGKWFRFTPGASMGAFELPKDRPREIKLSRRHAEQIGERLRDTYQLAGLNRSTFAKAMGVTPQAVDRMLTGGGSLAGWIKAAGVLKQSLDYLLLGRDDISPKVKQLLQEIAAQTAPPTTKKP